MTTAELTDMRPPPREEEPFYVAPASAVEWWVPLSEWRTRWPHSASVLDAWRAAYPSTAERLATWGAREPDKLRVLVLWASTNPNEPLGSFLLTRRGWSELGDISNAEPGAVEAFLQWARDSRTAAVELAVHQNALVDVGSNPPAPR